MHAYIYIKHANLTSARTKRLRLSISTPEKAGSSNQDARKSKHLNIGQGKTVSIFFSLAALHAWGMMEREFFFPLHNNEVCKLQGARNSIDKRSHMGIWRRPCARMMILFAMRVRDAGQKERQG